MNVYWAIGKIRRPIIFIGGVANGFTMNTLWHDQTKTFIIPHIIKHPPHELWAVEPVFGQAVYRFADRIENGHFVFKRKEESEL